MKKNIEIITLIALSFIGLLLMFVASTDPIAFFLENTKLEILFINDLSGNTIVFNLSIGLVVSCLFYFAMVYLPKQSKIKKVKSISNPLFEQFIANSFNFICTINKQADTENKLVNNDFTEDDLYHVCANIDLKSYAHKKTLRNSLQEMGVPDYIYNKTKGSFIYDDLKSVINLNDEIIKYYPVIEDAIDFEAISMIYDLKKEISTLKTILETDINVDFKGFTGNIFQFYNKVINIEKLYKENINSSYNKQEMIFT